MLAFEGNQKPYKDKWDPVTDSATTVKLYIRVHGAVGILSAVPMASAQGIRSGILVVRGPAPREIEVVQGLGLWV